MAKMNARTTWAVARAAEKALAEAKRRLDQWYKATGEARPEVAAGETVTYGDYRSAEGEYAELSARLPYTDSERFEAYQTLVVAAERVSELWQRAAIDPKASSWERDRAGDRANKAAGVVNRWRAEFVKAVRELAAEERR